MKPSHLVEILLPKKTGQGDAISKEWFDAFVKQLTDKFGGATSFVRSPGQGLWQSGGGTEEDGIAVIEVMVKGLDAAYWQSLREPLEQELSQEENRDRAHEISRL
jgi:hypothetical protein